MAKHRYVEAGKVEDLQHRGVGKQPCEMWCAKGAGGELNKVAYPVTRRNLHETEPIAMRVEAHGLGINGYDRAQIEIGREITVMEMNAHLGQLPVCQYRRWPA